MTQKWNLQDIKPNRPRRERPAPQPEEVTEREVTTFEDTEKEEVGSIVIEDGREKKRWSLVTALIVFFVLVGGGIIASLLMSGAELTVTPRSSEPNVNASFVAHTQPAAGDLPYEIMTDSEVGERQVSATGQEPVTQQAEGTLLIYNDFQTTPVRLVTNTRFEAPGGEIFRIKDSVVVPGQSTGDDGETVPGVISAEVFADEAGEEYNLEPTSFTIPGFAGEPEFDGVYGESVETFRGGFDGMKFIIDEDELKTATQALRTELRNALLERIESKMPSGFVVFEDAVTFTYESLPAVEYGDDLATIKESVTMRVPMFPESEFAEFIAAATIPGYEGLPVGITDPYVMSFDYVSATTSSSNIAEQENINFNLTGRPQIVWQYDEDKLKADLANKNRTALESVLDAYPAIRSAKATIRPFWKQKFPVNLDQIEVTEVIE